MSFSSWGQKIVRGRILIVDSNDSVLREVEAAIGEAPFDVQHTSIPDDALGYVRRGKVDILLVDESSVAPDFLEQVATERPDVVRILSACAAPALADAATDTRLLLKPWQPTTLQSVLKDALHQATVIFTASLHAALRPPPTNPPEASPTKPPSSAPPSGKLSRREIEVQALLAQGLGTAHIARKLSISVFTVRNHLQSIYRKHDIHSRDQLYTPPA